VSGAEIANLRARGSAGRHRFARLIANLTSGAGLCRGGVSPRDSFTWHFGLARYIEPAVFLGDYLEEVLEVHSTTNLSAS
jgi:hypothetical protein